MPSDQPDNARPSAAVERGVQSRPARRLRSRVVGITNVLLVLVVVAAVGAAGVRFLDAAVRREAPRVPSTMEDVDWRSPESSEYCLACHKPVGPAMAGLDVEHGHPQNVPLSGEQLAAIRELGTVVGPGNTLICMSCHQLGGEAKTRHMLADTVDNGQLCERCHPGHYARGTPHDLRTSAPDEINRLGETVAEGGPCSACHVSHRYARDFVPCPHDPDGRCTTCHEMFRCAERRARTHMEHPEVRCLECHDPHDMSHGEFLKLPAHELCVSCHQGYASGQVQGMHPVGPMEQPVPDVLIQAGAVVGADLHELTCTVCHSIHEAQNETLLVVSTRANELCLACHEEKLRGFSPDRMLPKHGQRPVLNEMQASVVAGWQRPVSDDGQLLCVSCHRVHGGSAELALVAFPPRYGETCGACHPGHSGVFGTAHDLRTNFPDDTNVAGMSVHTFGACSACHLAHQPARAPSPMPGDPTGHCAACHRAGECAAAEPVEGILHPDTICEDCHDPHERSFGRFLKLDQADLCSECHAEQMRLVGGPHDETQGTSAWKELPVDPLGICLTCHVPHGGERVDLLRVSALSDTDDPDGPCLKCHPGAAWRASSTIAAIHPREVSAAAHTDEELELVARDRDTKLMTCHTCHDPHSSAETRYLLRNKPEDPTAAFCIRCHTSKSLIRHTGHAPKVLAEFGFETTACQPCHAMHAQPDGAWGQMLSPRFLADVCEEVEGGATGCVPCLACHHVDGPAPVRAVAVHPTRAMFNVYAPDAPGYLPLFNAAGHVDPTGQVVCRTCHLSHGCEDLLLRVAQNEELTEAERSAVRTQLRHFVEPNVCTECHGSEARFRFLFFHDPDRRHFDRQDPTAQTYRD